MDWKLGRLIALAVALAVPAVAFGQANETSSPDTYSEGNYGPRVDREKAIEIAERSVKAQMKDPYSAMFEWGEPFQGYLRADGPDSYTYYGWVIEGTVNGKNSYGGYVGARRVLVVFQDGVPKVGKWETTVGYGRYAQTGMTPFPVRP